MANVNYAELTLAANTVGLLKAKTDLAAVTTAGAKTEAGIKKSMKGVEKAVKPVPQAARDAAAGMKDLRMALDPLYASSKKFEAVQKQVAAAVKKGAATQAEANRIMALAEDRYLGMGGAAEVAATRMGNGAGGLAHQSRMAAMQLSQVAQQTAATGNFIQALSIQLPDLALGFGALGIGIGVVAGALLPLAANFVTGGEGAMELSDALDNASSELAEYIDLMSQSDALGAERFERTRGQIELTSQAYSDLIAIAKIEAFNSIEALNESLVESAANAKLLKTATAEIGALLDIETTLQGNITVWKENRAQVQAFKDDLNALRDASSLEEQYAAALQLRDAFKQTVDVNGELTEEQLAFWKTLSQSIQKMEIMGAAIEAQASGMSKVEQAAAKAAQQYAKSRLESEKSAAAASELLSQLQQEAKVRSLTLRYGADSVQVANARLEAERRSFVTQVQARDISESLKQQLIGAWDAANGAASASAGLSGKLSQASAFAAQLVANLGQVPGAVAAIAGQVDSAINSLQTQNRSLTYQLEQGITASSAAIKAQRDEALKLAAENGATIDQLAAMGQSFDEQAAKAEQLATANNAMTKTLSDQAAAAAKAAAGASGVGKAAGGAGKAMKAAAKEAEKLADEIERLEFDADPLKKYNAELANLNELAANGLSDGAYAHAVAELNDEFANSDPMISKAGDAIADFVAGGLKDFDDLLGAFKNMLKEMIATAIANPIKLSLMGVGGGMAGTAAQAAGAAPGGGGLGNLLGIGGGAGGMFGSLLGAWGGGSGILGGASATIGAFMNGGISGGLGAIGSMAGQATAGLAGLGTAIGAIALPVAAVAAVFSFFKKKTEILDSGLRIMAEGMDITLKQFTKVKETRFWGLSKKVKMQLEDMEASAAAPLEKILTDIQNTTIGAAEALGVSADVFKDFTIEIDAATRGLSESEAQAKVQEVIGNFANNFAVLIPGIAHFTTEGENMYESLMRVVGGLQSVNTMFERLGFSLIEMSVEGAKTSEAFIDVFGSLEALNSAATAYYQRFYSDAERVARSTVEMRSAMADLGLAMPATIEGFRALVEQAERMGNLDRAGQLIKLSGAFANMIDGRDALNDAALNKATQDVQAAFQREMEATRAAFQSAISGLQDELTGARERLAASRAIANALESALQSRVFPSVEAERQSQDRAAAYLRTLVGQGQINDLDALQAALQAVANPSADTYETLEDYRRDFYRTSGVIAELEKTAGFGLNADEEAVLLLEKQIADMQAQSDLEVAMLQQQLDALLGINESVLSLKDAIASLKAAQAASSGGGRGSGSFTNSSPPPGFDHLANDPRYAPGGIYDFGSSGPGADGTYDFTPTGGGDGSDWQDWMRSVSSYDGGGYTGNGPRTGGLDGKGGFMAMMHPREVVTDTTKGSGVVASDPAVRRELVKLNEYIRELVKINNKQERRLREIELQGETA